MSYVLHRSLVQEPLTVVRGDGCYLFDRHGNKYLDGCGGAAVSCLGHSHPKVIEAICAQSAMLPYAHTSFFTTDALEELAETLVSTAPGMAKVLLLSGGSEAMEAALKLSRQYFVESGQAKKHLFIARRQSYHGNTLGALAVGGNEWRREPFRPMLATGHHIAPCFEYREKKADETTTQYGTRVASELEEKIAELGAENVAGFIAETVVGATAGAVPPVPGYFKQIRDVCNRHGVHLILDEVMCGTGRTGTMMAYEQEYIEPDLVTMAKGLAAGYQPIGALLCKQEITDTIRKSSGFFQHGHTFMGHATSVAAALATLDVIREDNLLENVVARGESIRARLGDALSNNAHVGDIRGRGLFIGIEFVADRDSKAPFDPQERVNQRIRQAGMQHGVMVYAMGGTIDGRRGDHVLIAPAYNIDSSQEDELVEKIAATVAAVLPLHQVR